MNLLENPTFLRMVPHLIKAFLIAMFLTVGAVAGTLFGSFLQVQCTRPDFEMVACQSVVKFLGLISVGWDHTSTGVLNSRVAEDCSGENDCTYTVVLVNRAEGNYRLNSFYFDQAGAQETVEGIKGFIADPGAPPFSRTSYDPKSILIFIFFPIPMLIAGIGTLISLISDLLAERTA